MRKTSVNELTTWSRVNGPIAARWREERTEPRYTKLTWTTMSGASAADVRSILSLPSPSTPAPSQSKKAATPLARKPSGISRELYSLIGPSAPTLVAQVAKPRLKQKPNLGGGGSSKWFILFAFYFMEDRFDEWRRVWRSFKNSARTDALELGHWVKANTDPDAGPSLFLSFRYYLGVKITSEYQFARYNAKSPDYTYSEDEYTKFLEGARLGHNPLTRAHIIGRPRMDKGRDRLPFQPYPRIRFSVLHCQ